MLQSLLGSFFPSGGTEEGKAESPLGGLLPLIVLGVIILGGLRLLAPKENDNEEDSAV